MTGSCSGVSKSWGGWAGRQPAPWEAGPSFVRRRWTNPPSPSTHVLRSGLSRSQEVTRTELVEAATIRDAIFRSTKAPPRTPLGMSVRNWCHFTVPPRPRTRPLSSKAHRRAISSPRYQ